jgi:hypothetical protein
MTIKQHKRTREDTIMAKVSKKQKKAPVKKVKTLKESEAQPQRNRKNK